MKRLDQLSQEDLYNYHDRMMGVEEEHEFNAHLFHADELGADDMLMAKEEYEQLDRPELSTEETAGRKAEARHQPHYWQDKRTPAGIKARVWRQTRKSKSEPAEDKSSDG